jgi:hypothetical protein
MRMTRRVLAYRCGRATGPGGFWFRPRGRDFRFGGQTRRGSRGAHIGLLTARERDDERLTPAGSGALMGLPRWYSRLLVCVDRAIRTGRG